MPCTKKQYHSEHSAQLVADELNHHEQETGTGRPWIVLKPYWHAECHCFHVRHTYDKILYMRLREQFQKGTHHAANSIS
jgi:hypothetical protein